MARGKKKINARESRREQALQQITQSMIRPYEEFVRSQLAEVAKTLQSRRAAQAAPPPGAGAPGAMPMNTPMTPSPPPMPMPGPPMGGGLMGPMGTTAQGIPDGWHPTGYPNVPGPGPMPMPGATPPPMLPPTRWEDGSVSHPSMDPGFVPPLPPHLFGGARPPANTLDQMIREIQMRGGTPDQPIFPPELLRRM